MFCEKCSSEFSSKNKHQRFCSKRCINLQDLPTRFWSKVDKNGPIMPHMNTPCWMWIAATANNGYGSFWVNERGASISAHIVAYELAYGEIPSIEGYHGTVIRHKCDNKPCCNPDHLLAGTIGDNNRDTVARGRHKGKNGTKPGEGHPGVKLSTEEVKLIRETYVPRRMGYRELGRMFDVHYSTIWLIVKHKNWTHI